MQTSRITFCDNPEHSRRSHQRWNISSLLRQLQQNNEQKNLMDAGVAGLVNGRTLHLGCVLHALLLAEHLY